MKTIEIRNKISEIKQKISELESLYLSDLKSQLKAEELLLEEEENRLIKEMKEKNIKKIVEEDYTVMLNCKYDLKVNDEEKFKSYIYDNAVSLRPLLSDKIKTKEELLELIMPRKFSLSNAKDLAKRALDIKDEVLPGFELIENQYISIKQK